MFPRAFIAVCLPIVAACGGDSVPLGPGASAQEAQYAAVATGQRDDVLALVDAQTAAWAAKDGVAYGATYSEGAELINPVGGLLMGRTAIANQHVFLFNPLNGPFRNSTSSPTVRDITFITGTVALVKLDVTLTGYSALPPGLPAYQPGVVRVRVTWVAVKQRGHWLIDFQQMTPLPPA